MGSDRPHARMQAGVSACRHVENVACCREAPFTHYRHPMGWSRGAIVHADPSPCGAAPGQQCADVAQRIAILAEAAGEGSASGADPAPGGFDDHLPEQIPGCDHPPVPSDVARRVDGDQLDRLEGKGVHAGGF